jgi:putative methyltransferase (TIGR04325 family)
MVNKKNLKGILLGLMPPIMVRAVKLTKSTLRKLFQVGHPPQYSPSVYLDVKDIPNIEEDVWSHPNWLGHVKKSLESSQQQDLPPNIHISDLLGCFLASANLYQRVEKLGVIDIGGGVGLYYPYVKKLADKLRLNVRYSVIDGPGNCRYGASYFKSDETIRFFEHTKSAIVSAIGHSGAKSVFNMSSTLHYILDWSGFLAEMTSHKPEVICISRFPSSDNATVTAYGIQNITTALGYCGRAKVVLLSSEMLKDEMSRLGYCVVSENGVDGDSTFYWEHGCSNAQYKKITLKSLVFVRN